MRVLIFAGAGTSVELGVPAMSGLATEFQAHCSQWNVQPQVVKDLLGDQNDVEVLIENLDKIDGALDAIAKLGPSPSLEGVHTVRSEVEWFVQHAAEKISAIDAAIMWGPVLRTHSLHQLTFVTTNYDRAIELAANAVGLPLDDGFEPFVDGEAASWVGFSSNFVEPKIAKLHGSTDWYSDIETGNPKKLRHPMPLFGRGVLKLVSGDQLGSAMILPSREKLLTRAPYPRMSQTFLNAVDSCEMAVFVGSSFRDFHVRDQAQTIARRCPLFIVNRSGSTQNIEDAIGIGQSASEFLISTLPTALASKDPAKALTENRGSKRKCPNVVQLLRIAMDRLESVERRCLAIEEIDALSLPLCKELVQDLIQGDNPIVARYALGLAAISPARKELIEGGKASLHLCDSDYKEELDLLEQFV